MEAINRSGRPRNSGGRGPMWPAPLTSGGLALEEITCRGWGPRLQYSFLIKLASLSFLIKLASLSGKYGGDEQGPQASSLPHPPSYAVDTYQLRPVTDRGRKISAENLSQCKRLLCMRRTYTGPLHTLQGKSWDHFCAGTEGAVLDSVFLSMIAHCGEIGMGRRCKLVGREGQLKRPLYSFCIFDGDWLVVHLVSNFWNPGKAEPCNEVETLSERWQLPQL